MPTWQDIQAWLDVNGMQVSTVSSQVASAWQQFAGTTTGADYSFGLVADHVITITGSTSVLGRGRLAAEYDPLLGRETEARTEWETDPALFIQERQARAREVLALVLTDEQLASHREHGYFTLRSNKGTRWRIATNTVTGNCRNLDQGTRWCAHPVGLPNEDCYVAQALTLLTDEDAFMAVANQL